jgi:uncharacterized membrane protein
VSSSWPSGATSPRSPRRTWPPVKTRWPFAGAVLGLWLIAALAINLGAKSLDLVPMAWVRRITAGILLALGIYTTVTALVG